MKDLDYTTDVSIDESALDVEWLRQPELTMKYCQLEAQAEREYEKAKKQLDIVSAELDRQIRQNPEEFELQKSTETEIRNTIQTQEKYKEAEEAVAEAKYNQNMAKGAVRAIYAKKDALENLVRLYGQQYFAGPKAPRDLSKEWEDKMNQTRSNKRVKIGGKKKKPKRTRKK